MIMDSMAIKLNFTWFNKHVLFDDVAIGKVLWGYFQAENYYYEDPIDKMVFVNKKVKSYLPNRYSMISRDPRRNIIKRMVRDVLPKQMYLYIHKLIWRLKFSI